MFNDLPSSKCPGSVGSSMLDLESRGPGSIPTKGGVIFCFKFYNPNVHNIARSDRIRFKTKNPIDSRPLKEISDFLAINTKLRMLASKDFTATNKLPPMGLDLMITSSRV